MPNFNSAHTLLPNLNGLTTGITKSPYPPPQGLALAQCTTSSSGFLSDDASTTLLSHFRKSPPSVHTKK